MIELVARGESAGQLWQRALQEGELLVIGRDPDVCEVPWEKWISRRHAELLWDGKSLRVKQLAGATNPIFHRGEEQTRFAVEPGDSFVVGRTLFTLARSDGVSSSDSKAVVNSYTVGADELQQVQFRDAPHRLDVLGHLSKVIFGITDEAELFRQTVNLLFGGIRRADAIAIVLVGEEQRPGTLQMLHSDRRLGTGGEFRPSERLAREAILKLRNSVVHVWSQENQPEQEAFTLQGNFDWAFCTPLRGDESRLGIYVAGRLSGASPSAIMAPWQSNDLSEDVKFTELVATIVSALRQVHALQHRQGVLSHFFSPTVLRVLSTSAPEAALQPRETEVTVQFCDVRGFSKKVEAAATNLPAILERVSAALGVMSTCILEHKGVVADFLGDAAMGFWGWPISANDDVQQACLSALKIRTAFDSFAKNKDHPLSDFRVGIGIATGHAVAGQIGSKDQAKVTVFGPVVNLASRLEGLTKILRAPILLDEATARVVLENMPRDVARCRRLAVVRPYGLETPLAVSELLLPASEDSVLSDDHLKYYEQALAAFLEGRWSEAYDQLHLVPPQDLGKGFLLSYILQHNNTAPPGWDGVIPIQSKT